MTGPPRVDRRTTIKWVLAAASSMPLLGPRRSVADVPASTAALPAPAPAAPASNGYGTDPRLLATYRPGDVWPLTLSVAERRTATTLCDVVIPADATSASASAVGVVDFIDEWISAPYPAQQRDRALVLGGLAWLDAESNRRFGDDFASLATAQQHAICDDICYAPRAAAAFAEAASFFARYRDLTAGGFYTTPEGTKDLNFVGNTPLTSFDGPPLEVLRRVGLA
jgi:hypothetical protein